MAVLPFSLAAGFISARQSSVCSIEIFCFGQCSSSSASHLGPENHRESFVSLGASLCLVGMSAGFSVPGQCYHKSLVTKV